MALQHIASVQFGDVTPGRVVNTKEIAEEYNIPLELLAKVLQHLAQPSCVGSNGCRCVPGRRTGSPCRADRRCGRRACACADVRRGRIRRRMEPGMPDTHPSCVLLADCTAAWAVSSAEMASSRSFLLTAFSLASGRSSGGTSAKLPPMRPKCASAPSASSRRRLQSPQNACVMLVTKLTLPRKPPTGSASWPSSS